MIKDIQIDEQLYDKDEIDRNILLYAGGLGNDGTNGQGQRYKPIDNEIPDSANVQANPGQGADEPQPSFSLRLCSTDSLLMVPLLLRSSKRSKESLRSFGLHLGIFPSQLPSALHMSFGLPTRTYLGDVQ